MSRADPRRLPARIAERLHALAPEAGRFLVGYSGGCDSHVLLHAVAGLREALAPAAVAALHVDHGVQADSRAWAVHCRAVCAELGVPCRVLRIVAAPGPGESPEAAARGARYRALAAELGPADFLLTAHHRDDQAETLLLQLLRGSGPAGLAAMPARAPLGAGWLLRPLLGVERASLRRYARAQGLRWVEDASNLDPALDRNFLRLRVLPLLRARWPALGRTLGRSAGHLAEAARLLEALALQDLAGLRAPGAYSLDLRGLACLDPARQRNALRAWLHELGLPPPSSCHLERVLADLVAGRRDAVARVQWPGAEMRRYRDRLFAMTPLPPHDPAMTVPWDGRQPLTLACPAGMLSLVPTTGVGLRADLCELGRLQVAFRRGGERCRPAGRGLSRPLKHLLQEAGIPPWERDRLPLLLVDGALAAVADLWVCEPYAAEAGEEGLRLRWQPAR